MDLDDNDEQYHPESQIPPGTHCNWCRRAYTTLITVILDIIIDEASPSEDERAAMGVLHAPIQEPIDYQVWFYLKSTTRLYIHS